MAGVPAFEFTHRAKPLVQTGRSERRDTGNRWGEGMWGSGLWGVVDWEVVWSDLTCEVHEITTNTGRGGATDRFVPATATIVASNVNQVSELIFPRVPETGEGFEFVPQPPIGHEEDLQAPAATTVISDGWKFNDDFETAPPRWMFPAAYSTTGTYPTVPMVWGDGYVTPETYGTTAGTTHEAHGVMQWTGLYPDLTTVECFLGLEQLAWLAAPSAGTAQCVVDVYAYGNRTNQAANCCRITMTPVFGGANTMTVQFLRLAADGSTASSIGAYTVTEASLRGTNGVFPTLDVRVLFEPETNAVTVDLNGLGTPVFGFTDWADGERLGFAVHYRKGTVASGDQAPPPLVTYFNGPDFTDEFDGALGSGWKVNRKLTQYGPMIVEGGAMHAPMSPVDGSFFNGRYEATGSAQWVSDFAGDQFIEVDVTGLSQPSQVGSAGTTVELYLKGNRQNLRSIVARLAYEPHWGANDNYIIWTLVQAGPNGEWVYDPDVEDESFGTLNLGEVDGVFPDATWRLEADTAGDVRLYYQHHLLGHALFPDIPDGTRIGIYEQWGSGGPEAGDRRGTVPRIERLSGGLQAPLGTEELGLWVRIGVDHQTLGNRWFFRGFCDSVEPVYDPEHADAVRIGCIDSLGEAGRVEVDGGRLANPFVTASTRVRQILDHASWPKHFRTLFEDATIMSRPGRARAVDLLTHVAESCGGAVYGDPATGDVVFKGKDWQGVYASEPPEAFITNYHPDVDDGIPRICPSGWERSSRRQDMYTRVKYSAEVSEEPDAEPIVKEWREPQAERLYGVEKYERTLLCVKAFHLNDLAIRQLRLRHPNQFPRIEAVVLDAATAVECLDLMTTATFTKPTKYWCQHHDPDVGFLWNRKMLVTGVRHRMTPTQWTCRLALDPSSVFYEVGGRWDEARWGQDEWGRSR